MIKEKTVFATQAKKNLVSLCALKVFFPSPLNSNCRENAGNFLIFKHVLLDLNFWTACLLAVFLLQAVLSH